ncbi:MFS transporter [bacterium]|nr:MFS transporter [bacterium]
MPINPQPIKTKKRFSKLPKFIRAFLPYKMKRQVKELFVASIIVNFALAMVQIFEPIYLHQMGYSLIKIAFFYLIVYVLYFFLLPFGAKFANKYGYENGMFLGSALYVIFYISLFLIPVYPILFYISAVIYTLQKIFYWTGFMADFAHNSEEGEEAREISSVNVSNALMFILGPVIGGLIITYFGFPVLFLIVSILFLVSNIPMLLTKEDFDQRGYKYIRIFDIFRKKNLKNLLACIGYAEELIVMVIWPIFMSIIIVSYSKIGALIGIATAITLLVTLYIGKICDKDDKRKVLRFGSIIYSLTWLIRIFTRTIIPIFLIDTTSKISKASIDVPIRAIFHKKARDGKRKNNNSIMENVVNYEAGLIIGKILACLVIIVVILIFSLEDDGGFVISFVFAGLTSLLYMLYK